MPSVRTLHPSSLSHPWQEKLRQAGCPAHGGTPKPPSSTAWGHRGHRYVLASPATSERGHRGHRYVVASTAVSSSPAPAPTSPGLPKRLRSCSQKKGRLLGSCGHSR